MPRVKCLNLLASLTPETVPESMQGFISVPGYRLPVVLGTGFLIAGYAARSGNPACDQD